MPCYVVQVTLTEGRHRQVRRMCELLGLKVVALKRVRIGPIRLQNLPVGRWTALPPNLEAQLVRDLVSHSGSREPRGRAARPRRERAPSVRVERDVVIEPTAEGGVRAE